MYTFPLPLPSRAAREQRHRGPQCIDAPLDVEKAEDGPGEGLLLLREVISGRAVTAFETEFALVEFPPVREGRKPCHLCMRAGQDLQPQGDVADEGEGPGVVGEPPEHIKVFRRDREGIFREPGEYPKKEPSRGVIHQDPEEPVLVPESVPGIPLDARERLPLHPTDP
mgnify:CR=1 FL=1